MFLDHPGITATNSQTPIVFWHEAPTEAGQAYRTRAWASKVGDGTTAVVHEF